MNPEKQLETDLQELHRLHKTTFNVVSHPDFTLVKERAIRRLTREEVDKILENFFEHHYIK